MALGFIKKVFSFGKKEVEERPAEDEPLAPLDFAALREMTSGAAASAAEAAESRAAEASPIAPAPVEPYEAPREDDFPARREVEAVRQPAAEPERLVGPSDASAFTPTPAEDVPAADVIPPIEDTNPEQPELPVPVSEAPPVAATPPQPALAKQEPALDLRSFEAEAPSETAKPPVAVAPHPEDTEPAAEVVPLAPPPTTPPAPAIQSGAALPSAAKVTVGKLVEKMAEPVATPAQPQRKSWFQRLRDGLARSSRELTGSIAGIFTKRKLDEETLEELEDVLIRADLGMETALRVTDTLASSRYGKDVSDAEVRAIMAQEVEKVLAPVALPLELDLSHKPHVILVVGVNGTGKTTTIGKLAAKLRQGGLSVMLAAGDTFRAAAIEQLKIWGERTGSPVVSSKLGADAAGLAWDAFEKAKAAGSDVLIIDTAGRLQNRAELMAELEKIVRVLGKHDPEAPHTVLQTVDATTGQNALSQVEIFRNVAGVTGLVMTKLDGTARGGILVAIAARHRLPVYFIGVGEQVDDLEPFAADEFAKAIAGVG